MPRLPLRLIVALSIAAAAPPALAASACHIQGQVGGRVIDECTQTERDIGADDLKRQCSGQVPGLAELGGHADARVVAACPAGAGGVCENPRGAPARIHYYRRSAEELATMRQACEMQRGTWVAP